MLILFRIDDRLIHAQVVVGWGRKFRPDRIILADDQVSAEEWEKELYTSAAEPDFKATVLTIADAAEQISGGVFDSEKIFLLVRGPSEALEMLDMGLDTNEINVGGLHFRDGREKITENVWVNGEEKELLRDIVKKGITLEARALPGDNRITINSKVV
jgi:mannose/fructose/N-acetylgalactosamine-specific phosphotransferase system component IIB